MAETQYGSPSTNRHPDGFEADFVESPFLEQICEFGPVEFVPVSRDSDITDFLAELYIHPNYNFRSHESIRSELANYARSCAWWLNLENLNVEPIVGATPRNIIVCETRHADTSLTRTDIYNFTEVEFDMQFHKSTAVRGILQSVGRMHKCYGPLFDQFVRHIVFARFTDEPELASGAVDFYFDPDNKFLVVSADYVEDFRGDPTVNSPAYIPKSADEAAETMNRLFDIIEPTFAEYYRQHINGQQTLTDYMVDRLESGAADSTEGQALVAPPQSFGLFLPTSIKP